MRILSELHVNERSAANDDVDIAMAMVEMATALRRVVTLKVGLEASFKDREVATLAAANEGARRCLQQDLQVLADGHGEHVVIDGELHRRVLPGEVAYHSLVGDLCVKRSTYRPVGKRNAPTVVALDLATGIMERATPALAYSVSLGYAKGDMRGHEEDLRAAHREPPSRTTLERVAKALGTHAKSAAPRIEAWLRQAEHVPQQAVAVCLGLDRTSVPMEEDRAVEQRPNSRRKKRVTPYRRKAPQPVDVNYRMAYVGTVSLTDPQGEALVTRRYAASAHEGPDAILRRMMADVGTSLRERPSLQVGTVQDGAPEMWNLTRAALQEQAQVTDWKEAIDRYHLNERLGEVLRIVEPNAEERHRQLTQWQQDFDTDDATIDCIEAWLAEEIDLRSGGELEALREHHTYIKNNSDRLRYASLRAVGLPVGSGVTEGACGSVVNKRAKGSGRRWRPLGLDAALTLRAIYCSDRLPSFFAHLSRQFTTEVRNAA